MLKHDTKTCPHEYIVEKVIKAANIGRRAALEELRMVLSTTRERNPLVVIDQFQHRWPNHGDFEREREARNMAQVAVDGFAVTLDHFARSVDAHQVYSSPDATGYSEPEPGCSK